MKKQLSILIIAALPAITLAAGDHAGGHDTTGMHASVAGRPGNPAQVGRTIEVIMDDNMHFAPQKISVKTGETIRFFVRNKGKLRHEMVIGSLEELKQHAIAMRTMPYMKHAEPNMITLAPGQRGGIVWQFDKPGAVDFACLLPGHMEAGMVGTVEVRPPAGAA